MKNRRVSRDDCFSGHFHQLPINDLLDESKNIDKARVNKILKSGRARTLDDFAALLSPAASAQLEPMAQLSQRITQQHFGKVIRLFAPIYLSNECVNNCKYCGFSRDNEIPRITLPLAQVESETQKLAKQGFRSLLIVAGEHPKYVSNGYVEEVIKACIRHMPGIALELGPLETEEYLPLVKAGCEGLIAYQETYHEENYLNLHTSGPKKHYYWRMDTAERAYEAGFRNLGIGSLFGLYDWRYEAIAVAAHASYLLKKCWKAQLSISLPRMRPAPGGYQPKSEHMMSDREWVQTICALRLFLPTVGFTLSTREPAHLRDGAITIGITKMSAGASTEPGAYSNFDDETWAPPEQQAGEQFHIADERKPSEISAMIKSKGYDPVWKDFDQSLASI